MFDVERDAGMHPVFIYAQGGGPGRNRTTPRRAGSIFGIPLPGIGLRLRSQREDKEADKGRYIKLQHAKQAKHHILPFHTMPVRVEVVIYFLTHKEDYGHKVRKEQGLPESQEDKEGKEVHGNKFACVVMQQLILRNGYYPPPDLFQNFNHVFRIAIRGFLKM